MWLKPPESTKGSTPPGQKQADTLQSHLYVVVGHPITKPEALIRIWSPLYCYNNLHSILECVSEFEPIQLQEQWHRCQETRSGSQWAFQFIPKVFKGIEIRPSKFFHTNLAKLYIRGPRFGHRGTVTLAEERAVSILLPQG